MAIHHDALRRDPLEGYLSGRWHTVGCGLILPLHPLLGFLVEREVLDQDNLFLPSQLLCNMPPV